MFALAISTGFIYPHVVALELTIRRAKKKSSAMFVHYDIIVVDDVP